MLTAQQPPIQREKQSDATHTRSTGIPTPLQNFTDNRIAAVAQLELAEMMKNSPRVLQQQARNDVIRNSPQMSAQLQRKDELVCSRVSRQQRDLVPLQLSTVHRDPKLSDANVSSALRSNSSPVAQLSLADLNRAQGLWNLHHAKHGTVDGHVQADIVGLQGAYNHYAQAANGGHNDAAADVANPFLHNSVLGLMHDMEEIDSHAGGYYYQQEVKAKHNAARDIQQQQGARGGLSNITDPDLIVTQGAGGAKGAVEVKRTTTQNGIDGMLTSAISQLSKRTGYSSATVEVEVTHPTQIGTITGNPGAVDNTVSTALDNRGFAQRYFGNGTPHALTGTRYIDVTVTINDEPNGIFIYDRDFRVHIRRTLGRGGRYTYSITMAYRLTTRV